MQFQNSKDSIVYPSKEVTVKQEIQLQTEYIGFRHCFEEHCSYMRVKISYLDRNSGETKVFHNVYEIPKPFQHKI